MLSGIAGLAGRLFDLLKKTPDQHQILLQSLKLMNENEQLGVIVPVFLVIPRSITFADASMERQPLALYDSRHPAVEILESIAQKLEEI